MYSVKLKKGEEKRILSGHPWVYANEVASISGRGKNGDLASVYSHDGTFIGKGYINHLSKILVRIFIRDENEVDDKTFYLKKLLQANEYRQLLGLENAYRVVFAEADGLPALIVDKYADVLSVQFLSLGIDRRKQLITECLVELFTPGGIYERSDVAVRLKEGLKENKGTLYGEVPDKVEIIENGLKMAIDVKNGQKSGYFLDQKENRFAAKRYASGKTVLDCFCNSGGFSINCATVSKEVIAVDVSDSALQSVAENAELNALNNVTTLKADAFEMLRNFKNEKKQFGLVILDPPAFCKSAAEVKDAYRGYKDINILGLKLVESGGFLITCSCSHYMSRTLFEKMLIEAAHHSGRTVRFVETKSQAPDHPALLASDETSYLKFYVLHVV